MYSGTYLSVIVIILAQLLPLIGVQVGSDELTTTIQTLVEIGAGIVILYKRWTRGDVGVFGFRK